MERMHTVHGGDGWHGIGVWFPPAKTRWSACLQILWKFREGFKPKFFPFKIVAKIQRWTHKG